MSPAIRFPNDDEAERARFWMKVRGDFTGVECWLWDGARDAKGYGYFVSRGPSRLTHRIAYEWLVGPIPDGLTLDHLCHNPPCVNPAHLEPVTLAENSRRINRVDRATCRNGHPRDSRNVRLSSNGTRVCRVCEREASQRYAQRQKTRQQAEQGAPDVAV